MRIVVTGANRGLGLGLTRAYAERGDEVWATARKPSEATDLQALAKASSGKVHVHELDVRNDEQVKAFATALGDASIDVLINNAGIAGKWSTTLATFDAEEALRCFDTNALGAIRVTRALIRNLRAAKGKVINMTSLMGSIADNGSGRGYAYRMSKAALNMATRNIAHEVKGFGGIAVALHPGWVKTEMGGEGAREEIGDAVSRIVALLSGLDAEMSGRFLNARGGELPF
jgi:NAD(P)-dependent dehydrogenase (short-subunit alcohol dehydrogenase family)